jgi:DNA (cytosine-5)-methyltransferase 1
MEEASLDSAPVWDDITTFDGKPWRGVVDIITSGDPCQPFSVAGKRLGESDERYIWADIARVVQEVSPRFVFLENVAGAIEFRAGCKRELEGMGYRVEAGLFSAEEVGAPHQRVRLFLLADSRQRAVPVSSASGAVGEGRGTTARTGGELAHSQGRRIAPRTRTAGHLERGAVAESGGELQHAENNAAIERISMAHTCGDGGPTGLSGQDQGQEGNTGEPFDYRHELPLFPPRPNDLEAWREVLEETEDGPCVEPAVRRMADWTTYRVERLQALGNAVVPLTAALAFVTLWGRLNDPL